MRAIYGVQTIDRTTGDENTVRVEASSPDEAREIVISMGEMVGTANLIEVLKDVPAESTAQSHKCPPGSIAATCPKCRHTEWTGGRGCAVWAVVILLFPIGLLALFIQPTWKCTRCGYKYQSFTPPAGLKQPKGTSVGYQILRGILFAILLL
ncbi:MAG: DUF2367 domain-containing protein, partial [Phycisphaerales bacterium]|nr:DUF2367 domain-containing protein [Phycisphaerales bacterium]